MSPPEQPAPSQKLELKVEPGFEGVIRLMAVPPVELHLEQDGPLIQKGRKYTLRLKGTQKNLAPPGGGGEAPQCRILIKAQSQGVERTTELLTALAIQGESCGASVEFDALEVGFIGKGTAQLSVMPVFPFATEFPLRKPVDFDNPLDVNGADAGQVVKLGKLVKFEPRISRIFSTVRLRLSVFHSPPSNGKRSTTPFARFEWTPEDRETHTWHVGCAESNGVKMLAYLETNAEEYAYDFVLEAFDVQGTQEVRYPLWERAGALKFSKPELKSFGLRWGGRMVVEIDNVDPDYSLPLELSLWTHKPFLADPMLSNFQVMNMVARPSEVKSTSFEFFHDVLYDEVTADTSAYFGLLRIPKSLSGTEDYVPISAVMKFSEKEFFPFDEDELWLEPPKQKGTKQSKKLKTPKELATAIASSELKIRPQRMPHFGDVTFGVREKNLVVGFKVSGETVFWKDAAPVFSLLDASGQSELMKLDAKPTAENARLYEVLLPLDDKRLQGQKVKFQAKVSNPDAKLWGELVAAPPTIAQAYEGVPRLSGVKVKMVNLTDETGYIQVRCKAQHIPTGKNGATLGFRVQEIAADLESPIAMRRVKFQYDVPKGAGGQCDPRGWFQARIMDPLVVQEFDGALNGKGDGKFQLEAYVMDSEGKVLGMDVAPVMVEFGDSPRSVTKSLIFGKVVPKEFREKVFAICSDLQIDPSHLMACMAFETGREFRASTKNRAGHDAYGLIQFTPNAVKDLKKREDPNKPKDPKKPNDSQVTLEELRKMSEVEQLDYVHDYFLYWKKIKNVPLKTLGDVYACIICPDAIGKDDAHKCYTKDTNTHAAFMANKGLARGKDYITKEDITVPVKREFEEGQSVDLRLDP